MLKARASAEVRVFSSRGTRVRDNDCRHGTCAARRHDLLFCRLRVRQREGVCAQCVAQPSSRQVPVSARYRLYAVRSARGCSRQRSDGAVSSVRCLQEVRVKCAGFYVPREGGVERTARVEAQQSYARRSQ